MFWMVHCGIWNRCTSLFWMVHCGIWNKCTFLFWMVHCGKWNRRIVWIGSTVRRWVCKKQRHQLVVKTSDLSKHCLFKMCSVCCMIYDSGLYETREPVITVPPDALAPNSAGPSTRMLLTTKLVKFSHYHFISFHFRLTRWCNSMSFYEILLHIKCWIIWKNFPREELHNEYGDCS